MKSKELKTYNLPADDLLISRIDAKPNIIFLFLMMLGFLSFLFNIPSLYGIMMILTSILAMAYMPRVVLIEFYQDYLVLYNRADKKNCFLIYYEDVVSWHYKWGTNRDYLYIDLKDGSTERLEAFSKTLFESSMNRFLKEKHLKGNR